MSDIPIHIAKIKQELAEMSQHGHQTNFGIEVAMAAVEYECDKILTIDRNDDE